ncbi:MAG: hypothetical protein ACKOYJ_11945 [Planctomycetia bacterium]
MPCDWFEQRWQAELDARRDPIADDVLASHADECSDCGEWLEAQRIMFGTLHCFWTHDHDGVSRTVSAGPAAREVERHNRSAPHERGWSAVAATAALSAAILIVSLIAVPHSPHGESSALESRGGWRSTVAEWSAASGRWLATNVAPVRSPAYVEGGREVAKSELSAWEFHWVARVGYSLAASESPPVEHIEELAGTIRPLATTMYRVVESLRPKWQSAPPLSPERERRWERQWENRWERQWGEPFRDGPREAPPGAGERHSGWGIDRSWMA